MTNAVYLGEIGTRGDIDIVDIFDKGGVLMWPLLALSFIAIMVIVICLWSTRKGAILPFYLLPEMEKCIANKKYPELSDMCERTDSSFTRTVSTILRFMRRNPSATIDEVREVAVAEGSRQANMLTRQISWLADIGGIAPMIGLLGTVIGMMRTFTEVAAGNFEGVKQMQMASGVSEAMITTAGGLMLAIPCMLFYVIFRNRIQKHINDMDASLAHILSLLSSRMD